GGIERRLTRSERPEHSRFASTGIEARLDARDAAAVPPQVRLCPAFRETRRLEEQHPGNQPAAAAAHDRIQLLESCPRAWTMGMEREHQRVFTRRTLEAGPGRPRGGSVPGPSRSH